MQNPPLSGSQHTGMSKTTKIVIGVVASFIVLLVGVFTLLFFVTGKVTKAADAFFGEVAAGNTKAAYDSAGEVYKSATSLEDFQSYAQSLNLKEYETSKWPNRNVTNGVAYLTGSLVLKNGGVVPMTVHLVKENGAWKVSDLDMDNLNLDLETSSELVVPNVAKIDDLVLKEISALIESEEKKDFTILYNTLSEGWKAEITPAELMESFAGGKFLSLQEIKTKKPVYISAPTIAEGDLEIKGYYPPENDHNTFRLIFEYEYPEWKLGGIMVEETMEELRKPLK